jgi:hypothetical protein
MISRWQIIADIGRKDRYLFCDLSNPDAHKPIAVILKFNTGPCVRPITFTGTRSIRAVSL